MGAPLQKARAGGAEVPEDGHQPLQELPAAVEVQMQALMVGGPTVGSPPPRKCKGPQQLGAPLQVRAQ